MLRCVQEATGALRGLRSMMLAGVSVEPRKRRAKGGDSDGMRLWALVLRQADKPRVRLY